MAEKTVLACPECGSSTIKSRNPESADTSSRQDYDPDSAFRCLDCNHQFNDAKERPPKRDGEWPRAGLARQLSEMDPNDLGGGD